MEFQNNTLGEKEIDNLEELFSDGVKITFIRVCPNFRIIEKRISIGFFSKVFNQIQEDFSKSGMFFNLNRDHIQIKDYFLFTKALFPNLKVTDFQKNTNNRGHPDFMLTSSGEKFYIEFKSRNDGIRPNQILWSVAHPEVETWFLVLGEIIMPRDIDRLIPKV